MKLSVKFCNKNLIAGLSALGGNETRKFLHDKIIQAVEISVNKNMNEMEIFLEEWLNILQVAKTAVFIKGLLLIFK